jgi:hypothetical protein
MRVLGGDVIALHPTGSALDGVIDLHQAVALADR